MAIMSRPGLNVALAIIVVALVITLWTITPFAVRMLYPDITHQGQFGDLFGSVNALFSGLAFVGVIFAILLQREELKLQRQELAATRTELARAAAAQEESRNALQKTIYAQAYKTANDVLQHEAVRSARRYAFNELRTKPFEHWSDDDRRQAEIVCHTYNTVGNMVRNSIMPVEYVVDTWGGSVQQCWHILKPLVKYRQDREWPMLWASFEYLSDQAALRYPTSMYNEP